MRWFLLQNSDAVPAIGSSSRREMPLKTFATMYGPMKHGVFPLLLLPLICFCASWRARTESSRSQWCPERRYLSQNPGGNSLWVFIRCFQEPRRHRGSKKRKTLLAKLTHNYSHQLSFKVIDQGDKNNIRWRSNQYVLGKTKLLLVVRCTNWENVTYRSTLPVANPINVHIAFHF